MHSNILNGVIFKEIETENYKFFTNTSEDKIILFKNVGEGFSIGDGYNYISLFAKEVENIYVDNLLILGLGSGLIPYYLSNRCKNIDVIEIDEELVNIIKWQNYLPENVNIICEDAYSYKINSDKKWDCIIIDIFCGKESDIKNKISNCKKKYMSHLNDNGFLYIPWNQELIYHNLWQV